MSEHDAVNHPKHYTSHPSGVECIQVTEHMGFNLGNAVKYIWRADLKADALEDLKKAEWYIQREIAKRTPEVPVYTDAQLSALAAARLRVLADAANVTIAEPAPIDPTWVDWLGGECPVPSGIVVEVKLRNPSWATQTRPAGVFDWDQQGWASDIVAYRIALPDSAKAQK